MREKAMHVLRQFCAAIALVQVTLVAQSVGMSGLVIWARAHLAGNVSHLRWVRAFALVIRFTMLIICLHLAEILLWACFFRWQCFAGWETAFYFSASSYSTVGYGDVLPPATWRFLGPVEGLTGVLMCGVSVSLLFAIVSRLVARDEERDLTKALNRTTTRLQSIEAEEIAAGRGKES